jgi:hypothetical protein
MHRNKVKRLVSRKGYLCPVIGVVVLLQLQVVAAVLVLSVSA